MVPDAKLSPHPWLSISSLFYFVFLSLFSAALRSVPCSSFPFSSFSIAFTSQAAGLMLTEWGVIYQQPRQEEHHSRRSRRRCRVFKIRKYINATHKE